jgi:hypothetical protein
VTMKSGKGVVHYVDINFIKCHNKKKNIVFSIFI